MPDQSHIKYILNSHHSLERAVLISTQKNDTIFYLMTKLFLRHVRLTPSIGWDDPSIRGRAIIDDGPDILKVFFLAKPNHKGHCL